MGWGTTKQILHHLAAHGDLSRICRTSKCKESVYEAGMGVHDLRGLYEVGWGRDCGKMRGVGGDKRQGQR